MLAQLADSQHQLAVLTNKPARISADILASLGLAASFVRVYGGDSLPGKKPDPIGLVTLMEETGSMRAETLMVGDSGVDVQTARNAEVRSCGVTWGFQPEAFENDPPDFVISHAQELLQHLAKSETRSQAI